MKIRNGFVSNSSSSSFCIMGVAISESELLPLYLKAMGKDGSSTIKPGCRCDIDRDAMKEQGYDFCPKCRKDIFVEIETEIYEMCEELELDYAYGESSDVYVGFSLESGTGVESVIKKLKDAEKKLKELFGNDVIISVHSGVTYN